jgi:hypothetical protein
LTSHPRGGQQEEDKVIKSTKYVIEKDDATAVHSEDDMLMIETFDPADDANALEILISPALFPEIRRVMGWLEDRTGDDSLTESIGHS